MALYLSFKQNNACEGFEWHVGQDVPFFPLSMLERIQADGHEKEYLQNIHVLHSLFGGKAAMGGNVIVTYNRDCALVVYGMMLADQAKRKFG